MSTLKDYVEALMERNAQQTYPLPRPPVTPTPSPVGRPSISPRAFAVPNTSTNQYGMSNEQQTSDDDRNVVGVIMDVLSSLGHGFRRAQIAGLEDVREQEDKPVENVGLDLGDVLEGTARGFGHPLEFLKGVGNAITGDHEDMAYGHEVAEQIHGKEGWEKAGGVRKFLESLAFEFEDPLMLVGPGTIGAGVKGTKSLLGIKPAITQEAKWAAQKAAAKSNPAVTANALANQGNPNIPKAPVAAPAAAAPTNVPPVAPAPPVAPPVAAPVVPPAGPVFPMTTPPTAVANVPPVTPTVPPVPSGAANVANAVTNAPPVEIPMTPQLWRPTPNPPTYTNRTVKDLLGHSEIEPSDEFVAIYGRYYDSYLDDVSKLGESTEGLEKSFSSVKETITRLQALEEQIPIVTNLPLPREITTNMLNGVTLAFARGKEAKVGSDVVAQQIHNVIADSITHYVTNLKALMQERQLAGVSFASPRVMSNAQITGHLEQYADDLLVIAKEHVEAGQAIRAEAAAQKVNKVADAIDSGKDASKAAESFVAANTTDDLEDVVQASIRSSIPEGAMSAEDAEGLKGTLVGFVKEFKDEYGKQQNPITSKRTRTPPYITAYDSANNVEKIRKRLFDTRAVGVVKGRLKFSLGHRAAAVTKAAEIEQARLGRAVVISRVQGTSKVRDTVTRYGAPDIAAPRAVPITDDLVKIEVGEDFNRPFSLGKLMEDMAGKNQKLANYVFLGRRPGKAADISKSRSPLITQAAALAAFKNKEAYEAFLNTARADGGVDTALVKEAADWLMRYDAPANSAYAASLGQAAKVRDANTMADIADAVESSVATTTTAAETAHVAAQTANQVTTGAIVSGQISPGSATAAQNVASQTAQKVANAAGHTITPTGAATAQQAKNLGPISAATTPAQAAKTNKAAKAVAKAAGVTKAKKGQTANPVAFNGTIPVYQTDKQFWQRIRESWIPDALMKHIRPGVDQNIGLYKMQTAVTARFWQDLKTLDPNESMLVLKALGDDRLVASLPPHLAKIHKDVNDRMIALFGAGDFKLAQSGMTMLNKTGLDIDRLNVHMRAKAVKFGDRKSNMSLFQFKDPMNLEAEWKAALTTIQNPQEARSFIDALHDIESSAFAAVSERFTIDDAVTQFGSDFAVPGWVDMGRATYNNGNPLHLAKYLEGTWMPPELAGEIGRLDFFINETLGQGGHKFWREWDFIQRKFKTGVTIPNPVHHERNFAGDIWLGYADGINMVHWVPRAIGVLKKTDYKKGTYRGIPIEEIKNPYSKLRTRLYRQADTKQYGKGVTNKSSGITFDGDQLRGFFALKGLEQSSGVIEDINTASTSVLAAKLAEHPRIAAPFSHKLHRGVSAASEAREHSTRMAHFMGAISDTKLPNRLKGATLKEKQEYIINKAAHRAKKYHPDGLSMTKWEKTVMARAIPFYSWQRKAMPLIMATMVKRPVLTSSYTRFMDAVTAGAGYDPGDLPDSHLIAHFLREPGMAMVGFKPYEHEEGRIVGGGYRMLGGPSSPPLDILNLLGGKAEEGDPGDYVREVVKQVAGSTSPLGRVIPELVANKQFSTDIPINPEYSRNSTFTNYRKYLLNQVPFLSTANRWTGNQLPAELDLANWLAATHMADTGPYVKTAEFEAKERARKEAEK